MRKITKYSTLFRESVLAKLLAPNGPSAVELSKELNIPYGTIYTWISTMKKKNKYKIPADLTPMRPKDRTAEFKLQAVIETISMTADERGVYCREHGLYTHNLDEWKAQVLSGLSSGAAITKKEKVEQQQALTEMKKLKSDLHRKNKALAEVSALLILKKKADLIWGSNEDD